MSGSKKSLLGMIHLQALPGTPASRRGGASAVGVIVARAVEEARVLVDAGFDGVMIENMHDRPYVHGTHTPETTAIMTRAAVAVRGAIPKGMPLGVQVLSGGNREALAISLAAHPDGGRGGGGVKGGMPLAFIRCENFVFSHVADEGLLERAEAGPLLRYRRGIGAEEVSIFVDVKKKHASHAITGDITLTEAVEAAEFFGADGVIITGQATGKPAAMEDIKSARRATRLPILVGSGVTPENVAQVFEHADAAIVGSSIKRGGVWSNPLDAKRCKALVNAAR
jgi:membrane complex biogenesis BtpA family protein